MQKTKKMDGTIVANELAFACSAAAGVRPLPEAAQAAPALGRHTGSRLAGMPRWQREYSASCLLIEIDGHTRDTAALRSLG
jgi:hypothetical protein